MYNENNSTQKTSLLKWALAFIYNKSHGKDKFVIKTTREKRFIHS